MDSTIIEMVLKRNGSIDYSKIADPLKRLEIYCKYGILPIIDHPTSSNLDVGKIIDCKRKKRNLDL